MGVVVIQYGFGEIGREIAGLILGRREFELSEVVDTDEDTVGMRISDILNVGTESKLRVTRDLSGIKQEGPLLAFQSTGSRLQKIFPQLKELIEAGANVVSTAEELAYPYLRNRGVADKIDGLAKKNGVTVLGTGINPGFIMDLLPLIIAGVSRHLESIEVLRVQDGACRRRSLQEKIGVGLSPDLFDEKIRGSGGHVGLSESLALIASGLGWRVEAIQETVEPVIAEERVTSEYFEVQPGEVAGVDQVVRGFAGDEEKITLILRIYLGAEKPVDRISITGVPDLQLEIPGGIHGDIATPAVAVNSARTVLEADPGLITPLDMSPFLGNFGS
ncbi:dihydrodipicolinate reductase [Candidatus Bipolaricaulota bacterium]|nr:dihydrodipicolinate reductase [Candidatus Bipolaricaulota bacterium]